jgi:hypothetical protein
MRARFLRRPLVGVAVLTLPLGAAVTVAATVAVTVVGAVAAPGAVASGAVAVPDLRSPVAFLPAVPVEIQLGFEGSKIFSSPDLANRAMVPPVHGPGSR